MSAPLGIMFHHFHGQGHAPGQGSLSQEDLARLIRHLQGRLTLIQAREFLDRAGDGTLTPGQACLTFDDSLRCQYDLALPVLKEFGLTAFWFVYTSPLEGGTEPLEIYRHFRNTQFSSVEDFNEAFVREATRVHGPRVRAALEGFCASDYLPDYPFYSDGDRTLRYLRDEVLAPEEYDGLMQALIKASGQNPAAIASRLWMRADQLRELQCEDHVVGLHSHTHPMNMERLSPEEQEVEFGTNHRILTDVLGHPPVAMSHPCNRYTSDTLAILAGLGIRLGFRADTALAAPSPLEYPREDHANIFRSMKP